MTTTLYDYQGNAIEVSGSGDSTLVAEPEGYDLPSVYWEGLNGALPPEAKADGDIAGKLIYVSKNQSWSEYCTIKVQGNSTTAYPKKNYTLKTYSDAECTIKSKHEFLNWGKLSKFVLKANWLDFSHIRNIGCSRIWGQIVRSRSDYNSLPTELIESANQGATDGFHVRMFINGQYWGLYEWIIPKDKIFNQDSDNPLHSIRNANSQLDLACYFRKDIDSAWSWEEELNDAPQVNWNSVLTLVNSGTDSAFLNNNILDLQSVIDYDIFIRIIRAVDSVAKNQIFFTYDGTKWYEGCWDCDYVLGGPSAYSAYDTEFQTGYMSYLATQKTNLLYDRVESLMTSQFKARYAELRAGVLSENNIISVFEELAKPILHYDGLYAEDYAQTTGGGAFTNMPSVTTNNIQQIRTMVHDRTAYMDTVIEAM